MVDDVPLLSMLQLTLVTHVLYSRYQRFVVVTHFFFILSTELSTARRDRGFDFFFFLSFAVDVVLGFFFSFFLNSTD
jgi:hypothetical protein